jgi:hypothetical protein
MGVNRPVAALALGLAAAAGLALPAVVSRSNEPALVRPVELRDDRPEADGVPPAIPSEPVPVAPSAQSGDDRSRPVVEDDDDAQNPTRGRPGRGDNDGRGGNDRSDDAGRSRPTTGGGDDDGGDDDGGDDDGGDDDGGDDDGGDDDGGDDDGGTDD